MLHDAHIQAWRGYIRIWNALCDWQDSGHREADDRRERIAARAEYDDAKQRKAGRP